MSIFSELIAKIKEISNSYTTKYNDELKAASDYFDKFEEEYQNSKIRGREKAQKEKVGLTTLQSINEDDSESNKVPNAETKCRSSKSDKGSSGRGSLDSGEEQRASKKRSKHEVEDMLSPEQEKRQKRNASVKAQSIISKQVNVNLSTKLRRDNSNDKVDKTSSQSSNSRRRKDEKENSEPNVPISGIQIKQEKISLPSEPMDTESLPVNIVVKKEVNKDDIAMPPPAVPVPKPRKALVKQKSEEIGDEETGKRRTRTKKQSEASELRKPLTTKNSHESDEDTGMSRSKNQTEAAIVPPVAGARSTRASSRAARHDIEELTTEARPKRTRAKKKTSQVPSTEVDSTQTLQESVPAVASPAEKPRPKRTRRGKAAEKQEVSKPAEVIISPREKVSSPILMTNIKTKIKKKTTMDIVSATIESSVACEKDAVELDATKVIPHRKELDETVVLPNGVYNHAPLSPQNVRNMNETVVIEKTNIEKDVVNTRPVIMDCTVVLEKGLKSNLTKDNSLITDDESDQDPNTPPKYNIPQIEPTSAVKEKVQQFEEMATRVTRTKTRAMVKKEEQPENQTPPDKISKPVLSAETLSLMNNLIFNGKPAQTSSSACKPRAVVPVAKTQVSSTSKLSSLFRHKEAAEESLKNSEDARKKKEAMLEAKKEQQKRKREEKMAAAAAARSAAERERRAALQAAARERLEKQAHADAGKLERQREVERKKQELARKVLEMEERRKAEEAARMQRLAEDQRRALALRRKQLEEQEATKKEAAIMAKEIEKRQKEYIEKQKKKLKLEGKMHTLVRTPGTPGGYAAAPEPVYMADGFQYLYSDEDEEPPPRPVPEWSTSKARMAQLEVQSHSDFNPAHISRLFAVGVHRIDLRDIFPNIDRARLKRTSSAVWRTPPPALPPLKE